MSLPFSTATGADVRVRFCPSPTGTPHVGMVRTALFNWAYARHTGGKLVFRIEDTDAARDSEESYLQLIDALSWLGIDWDEGVEKGGPHGPYRQSQRTEIYLELIERLTASGHLYEIVRHPRRDGGPQRRRRPRSASGLRQLRARPHRRAARRVPRRGSRSRACGCACPTTDLVFDDLIRGEITFPAGSFTDFVVVRPNGAPLYTFVNPVDDALMGVTHVLPRRGHPLVHAAPDRALPRAHRDRGHRLHPAVRAPAARATARARRSSASATPSRTCSTTATAGSSPRGCSTTWRCSAGRSPPTATCSPRRSSSPRSTSRDVNPNPARFDLKKAESINGDHIRLLAVDDFTDAHRAVPRRVSSPIRRHRGAAAILREAAPLVQERIDAARRGARHARRSSSPPTTRSTTRRTRCPRTPTRRASCSTPPRPRSSS